MAAITRASMRRHALRISLSGAGFMGCWHLGVGHALQQAGALEGAEIAGASAGAIVGAILTTDTPLPVARSALSALVAGARAAPAGVFTPGYCLVDQVRDHLCKHLPVDAHQQASGRLHVSLTSLRAGEIGRMHYKTAFASRDELIDDVVTSSDIPGVTGLLRSVNKLPEGFTPANLLQALTRRLDVDGGLLDIFPDPWDGTREVVFVSPFAGTGLDVAPSRTPRQKERVPPQWTYRAGRSIDLSLENLARIRHTLDAPPDAMLEAYEAEAFERCVDWMTSHGLVERSELDDLDDLDDPRLDAAAGVPPGLPPHLHQMAEELASGHAQLFDVREVQDAIRGKLKASVLVPLSELQQGWLPSKKTADPTKLTYLHCAAGVRVHPSAQMLEALGYERVVPLQEGFGALAGMGFDLEN